MDVAHSVIVFVLLTTGAWQSEATQYPSREVCQYVRQHIIEAAMRRPDLTLVSDCAAGDESVVFRGFGSVPPTPDEAPAPSDTPPALDTALDPALDHTLKSVKETINVA